MSGLSGRRTMPDRPAGMFRLGTLLIVISMPGLAGAEMAWVHRAGITGNVLHAKPSDLGGDGNPRGPGSTSGPDAAFTLSTQDQQSLRSMLEVSHAEVSGTLHAKLVRVRAADALVSPVQTLHRVGSVRATFYDSSSVGAVPGEERTQVVGWVDQAYLRVFGSAYTFTAGRQPIDYGTGRLWQPLNVFGAFAPTDLDTEFKPGVDALTVDWYPGAFSSLTTTLVAASRQASQDPSFSSKYRQLLGEDVDMNLLAGYVVGHCLAGFSIEGEWQGMGWRWEALATDESFFSVTGVDYQFSEEHWSGGVRLVAELYFHSGGSTQASMVAETAGNELVQHGLQPHVGRHLVGLSLDKSLTPLVTGGYLVMLNPLESTSSRWRLSSLHQATFRVSAGENTEVILALQIGAGEGLDARGLPQSEFGAVPGRFTFRWASYF